MSYEVTANRKRPSDFGSLVGQEFVVTTLKNSLTQGRIAHAYLFAGPRGVGKTSAARILAKALNCEKGPTPTPCGVCSQCREISSGSALDVIEIDGASNTSVNDVREIKDEVLFAPASGRYKVYIIDEVHMLSNSAFNALLKTIEEPPPYIVFIFATTEIHKVPPTIRSRCQQFNFRLIPLETILTKLQEASQDLGIQAEEAALLWIAKEATGSLRDAYTIFDQVVSFAEGNLTLKKIQDTLGLTGFERVNTLVELLSAGKGNEALRLFDEVMASGVAVEQFVIELTDYYRSLLFLKLGIQKPSLLGYTVERFSPATLQALSVRQIEKALSLLFELYRNLRYTINGRFEVELVLSRLADLRNYLSREELLERIQGLRRELRYATGEHTQVRSKPSDGKQEDKPKREEETLDHELRGMSSLGSSDGEGETSDSWQDEEVPSEVPQFEMEKPREKEELEPSQRQGIILSLKRKKLTLSSTLEKAEAWRWQGNTLIIVFRNKFSADLVQADLSLVTQKVREVLGRAVEVVVRFESSKVEPEGGTTSRSGDTLPESASSEGGKEDRIEIARKVFRGEIIQ
ncbi:MAG: DNA polymerase III subunit gamma/tau [Spirochaetes bacterium]|nr:DNA polymerase III subunit gamma/tau [Spirochaetota bacterium]